MRQGSNFPTIQESAYSTHKEILPMVGELHRDAGKLTAGSDRTIAVTAYVIVYVGFLLASIAIAFFTTDIGVKLGVVIVGAITAIIFLIGLPSLLRSSGTRAARSLIKVIAEVFDPRSFIVVVFVVGFVVMACLIAYFRPTESTKFLDSTVAALISVVTIIVGFYFGQKTAEASFEAAKVPEISGFPMEFKGPVIKGSGTAGEVIVGGLIQGSGSIRNRGNKPIYIRNVCIAVRPPGVPPTAGPFRYDIGLKGPMLLDPGESVSVEEQRIMPEDIPERYFEDQWYAFITCQREDGYWHDGPDKVSFTVKKKS